MSLSDDLINRLESRPWLATGEHVAALIAELRASRKVVEAGRQAIYWMQRGSSNYAGLRPLQAALAELSTLNVRSEAEK